MSAMPMLDSSGGGVFGPAAATPRARFVPNNYAPDELNAGLQRAADQGVNVDDAYVNIHRWSGKLGPAITERIPWREFDEKAARQGLPPGTFAFVVRAAGTTRGVSQFDIEHAGTAAATPASDPRIDRLEAMLAKVLEAQSRPPAPPPETLGAEKIIGLATQLANAMKPAAPASPAGAIGELMQLFAAGKQLKEFAGIDTTAAAAAAGTGENASAIVEGIRALPQILKELGTHRKQQTEQLRIQAEHAARLREARLARKNSAPAARQQGQPTTQDTAALAAQPSAAANQPAEQKLRLVKPPEVDPAVRELVTRFGDFIAQAAAAQTPPEQCGESVYHAASALDAQIFERMGEGTIAAEVVHLRPDLAPYAEWLINVETAARIVAIDQAGEPADEDQVSEDQEDEDDE